MDRRLVSTLIGLLVASLASALFFLAFHDAFAGMLSTGCILGAFGPYFSSPRQAGQFATTIAWLTGAVLAFSNVMVDGLLFLFLFTTGAGLATAWLMREACRQAKPASRVEWMSVLLAPASMILALALAQTDQDLRLRLALSEPAFRAEVRQLAAGQKKGLIGFPRRVGLFWTSHREMTPDGCFWTTGGTFMNYHGLAYLPGDPSATIKYRLEHIQGSWWKFEFHF